MRTPVALTTLSLALAWGIAQGQEAQPAPVVGPPFAEVEARWTAFWTQVAEGDLAAAGQYIHSSARHLSPTGKALSELQDLARQMAFCQMDPSPLPIDLDKVVYLVRCRQGGETAETLLLIRLDADGVWRLIPF